MRIAVGLATAGRPRTLEAALSCVYAQTRRADAVIVCYTGPNDITGVSCHDGVILALGAPGLPGQRNVIIGLAADAQVVVFFDDDFLASPDYLKVVERVFSADPCIVAATGDPIADGARGPGIGLQEAIQLIAQDEGHLSPGVEPAPHAYGCNMAICLETARKHHLSFDERLPLYAWSEDVDFTHRIARYGKIVKMLDARGVHLGTKSGRSSGRRLGYSQVANPIYLRSKGSYSWRRALGSVGRNVAANSRGLFWPEPFIDRRGRLLGNIIAFGDLLRGRLMPERILDL